MNVPMNRPIVTWVTQSWRKRYRRRGPNSVATIDSTSRATEKISASTVATAPIIADRIARASSMLPIVSHDGMWMIPFESRTSGTRGRPNRPMAARDTRRGIRHRFTSRCEGSFTRRGSSMRRLYRANGPPLKSFRSPPWYEVLVLDVRALLSLASPPLVRVQLLRARDPHARRSCAPGGASLSRVHGRVGGDAAVARGHRLRGACVLVLAVRTGRPRGPPPGRAHPFATNRRPLARVHRPQPGVPRVALSRRGDATPGGRPVHAGRPVAGHRRRLGKGRFRRPGAGGRSFHRPGRSGTGKALCGPPLVELE